MTVDEKSPAAVPDKVRRTWRLVVAYHGRSLSGWQTQEGVRTVQAELERALHAISGEDVRARGAGRTDAGVHARGQVVSATFASRVPASKMLVALGSQLPDDIAVVQAQEMPDGFDAKRHSVGKRYVYRVHLGAARDVFRGSLSWHVRAGLDVDAMREAASHFVGERDFESFRSLHCDALHARRYVWRASIDVDGDELALEIRGNAFCRHMVRCIAGTLVDVGRGRLRAGDIEPIFVARDRRRAGMTAPAHGLTLEEVYYPDTLGRAGIPAGARFPGFPVEPQDWPPTPRAPPEGA